MSSTVALRVSDTSKNKNTTKNKFLSITPDELMKNGRDILTPVEPHNITSRTLEVPTPCQNDVSSLPFCRNQVVL